MPIPDFQSLMLPMLKLAADGQNHRLSDVIELLAQQFALSEAERSEMLPSGVQSRFVNTAGWARTHLGKALLLESPRRGWFHITERGREVLADPPERITIAYLMRYPEFVAFRTRNEVAAHNEPEDEPNTLNALEDVAPTPDVQVNEPTATKAPSPISSLSFTDAAEQVLQRFGSGQAMHYQTITRHALEQGLITTAGQTPAASMYAVILTEIDRALKRGEQSRFIKHGRGMVGLTAWEPIGLPSEIAQHNRAIRQQLHQHLHQMPPAEFEGLIGKLLSAIGFAEVIVTAASGDGGIDVRGTLVVGDVIRTRMAVQVKRWKRNVQAPVIQQVRGSLGAHEQGLIITTSDFSKGARDEAARSDATPVALMHGEQLVTLLIEHNIGVRRASYDLIELGESEE